MQDSFKLLSFVKSLIEKKNPDESKCKRNVHQIFNTP